MVDYVITIRRRTDARSIGPTSSQRRKTDMRYIKSQGSHKT